MKDLIAIKTSNIPGAGMGAFARTKISKGQRIGEYTGRLLDAESYDKLRNKLYTFEVAKKYRGRYYTFYIDASNPKKSGLLRYVNGALGKQQRKAINVESYQYAEKIYYRATKNIKPGDEIIIDYGDNYWHD